MIYRFNKYFLMAGLSLTLLLFTNCENKDLENNKDPEIVVENNETEGENDLEADQEVLENDEEIDKELEEFLSLTEEEKEEILEEVLNYNEVKASNTITHITIDQGEDSTTHTVHSYTNYDDSKKILSQELMIGEANSQPIRKTFNNGVEESKGMAGSVDKEEREQPEIYYSYYNILDNLKELKDYLEVEKKANEAILSFKTDDVSVYELLKDDFQIGLNMDVKEMNSYGEYRFNEDKNLIQVIQTFYNDAIKIHIRSNFEELDVPYEIPEIQ